MNLINHYIQSIASTLIFLAVTSSFFACNDFFKTDINSKESEKPNIIFILADDLGFGDVEHFNNFSKIPTPNLNKMAMGGASFFNAHSPAAVCTPTRYSFLTGKYPWRSDKKNGVLWVWGKPFIKKEDFTVARMLQDQGYHTACVGKWHLGWNWPTIDGQPATLENEGRNVDYSQPISGGPVELGFNYYFGDDVPGFPPHAFIENDRMAEPPNSWFNLKPFIAGASTEGWRYEDLLTKTTDKAVDYIVDRAHKEEPFFLYYAMTAPHTPIAPHENFVGKTNAGIYGDFVHEVDHSVGRLVKVIDSLGVAENTILIFTSDNGSTTQDGTDYNGLVGSMKSKFNHDGSGGLRGLKADIFEGGHRVPFIVRWKGKIEPATSSNAMIQHTDMMHTFASLTNYNLKDNQGIDSFNVLPNIMGTDENSFREALVTQSSKGALAVQIDEWKLIMSSGSGGFWTKPFGEYPEVMISDGEIDWSNVQLYNLNNDLAETKNLAKKFPDKVNELAFKLKQYVLNGRSRDDLSTEKEIELWDPVKWIESLRIAKN